MIWDVDVFFFIYLQLFGYFAVNFKESISDANQIRIKFYP